MERVCASKLSISFSSTMSGSLLGNVGKSIKLSRKGAGYSAATKLQALAKNMPSFNQRVSLIQVFRNVQKPFHQPPPNPEEVGTIRAIPGQFCLEDADRRSLSKL